MQAEVEAQEIVAQDTAEQVTVSEQEDTAPEQMATEAVETAESESAESEPIEGDAPQEEEQLPLAAKVSALLFSSPKPLTVSVLEELLKAEPGEIEGAFTTLKEYFRDEIHGFSLREVAGGWCYRTAPQAAKPIREMLKPKAKKLSRAAAETLAVIAYKQPVQRAEIEAIRGVDVLPTLKTLLDAKLVRIVGHEDAVGHPALYGTTQLFLEKFGLKDLSELPNIRELERLEEEPGEAEEPDLVEAASDADEEQSDIPSTTAEEVQASA